jgi:hypothetical protein
MGRSGFWTGAPLSALRSTPWGDLEAATTTVVEGMEAPLGPGPVTGRMTAFIIKAHA